jgi:FlaA1/EpsC-like NDP-sugar epimerase
MWHYTRPYTMSRQSAGQFELRALVVGAGAAGRTIARDLTRVRDVGLRPIGFLDDDQRKHRVGGLPVFGGLGSLRAAVDRLRIDVVVIAIPGLAAERIRAIADDAAEAGAQVRVLPSFLAAIERDARADDLRQVHLDALLGRTERDVSAVELRNVIAGKRVLVTGAGGSIGSELCRQVRRLEPRALCLLDHDESNLHQLQLDITGEALLDTDEIVIADIRDRTRIDQVFGQFRPDVVLHAAAHKHLPLLERHPCEGVKTNVFGTQNLVEAAIECGTERMVLISTDKAADPTSVLGATKRLAELVVKSNAVGTTSLGSVRFGNVLGSRGSFLGVVRSQLRQGRPVTVTHADVTRYFMTVEEAVGLVLGAATMAEYGEIFVLDMGEPVRIVDLVRSYARELGITDYRIEFTGLRPGEKLEESLTSSDDMLMSTVHPKIMAAREFDVPDDFGSRLAKLYVAADGNDAKLVLRHLQELLPEYRPSVHVPHSTGGASPLAVPYPDEF